MNTKIEYAIMGSDTNPMYIDFWPLVSKVWKTVFNITPVLGLIGDEDSDFFEDEYGLIKKFKRVDGINTGLQSQIVRLFLPNHLEGNILLTDIDMLPMSKNYFIENIKQLSMDKFYVFSSDHKECLSNSEYPICYNFGHSDLFRKILNINITWKELVEYVNSLNFGWSSDQKILFQKINEFKQTNPNTIELLGRGWLPTGPANCRIDRICWNYNPHLIKSQHYIDCHMLRPYATYKNELDTLVSYLY